jgi:hypothetical protein
VVELRIPVRMFAALPDLAVGLATVIQLSQQSGNNALADVEALFAQRFDEVALAAADPTQGRAGIAADRCFDQGFQRCGQIRLMRHRALAPAAGAAHPPADGVAGRAKLLDAAIDRAPRQPRRSRGRRHTPQSERQGSVGCEQAPAAFVQERCRQLPARSDVVDGDHAARLAIRRRVAPTGIAILSLRSYDLADSIISRRALRAVSRLHML